jgi:hypothetical protein
VVGDTLALGAQAGPVHQLHGPGPAIGLQAQAPAPRALGGLDGQAGGGKVQAPILGRVDGPQVAGLVSRNGSILPLLRKLAGNLLPLGGSQAGRDFIGPGRSPRSGWR